MSAPGLENGLRILEYINNKGEASFMELSRELEINKGSLSRFLKVLLDRDYLSKNDSIYCQENYQVSSLFPEIGIL